MRHQRSLVVLGALAIAVVVLSTTTFSLSSGITRSEGLPEEGCVCHGPNRIDDGVPNPNVRILVQVEGNPMVYRPGETYEIRIAIVETDVPADPESNQGGFNIHVNVGEFGVAEGWEEYVRAEGSEATHTPDGAMQGRSWNLTWTAPTQVEEPAIFKVFTNSVQGNFQNDEDDHWNGMTFVVLNRPDAALGEAARGPGPEELGVSWLAHWVGIISFVAVALTLLIYYFVLKYGESVHTTDHRDRKEK